MITLLGCRESVRKTERTQGHHRPPARTGVHPANGILFQRRALGDDLAALRGKGRVPDPRRPAGTVPGGTGAATSAGTGQQPLKGRGITLPGSYRRVRCAHPIDEEHLINSSFPAKLSVDPESSGTIQCVTGLFAALTLRDAPRAFNALRAFLRHAPE